MTQQTIPQINTGKPQPRPASTNAPTPASRSGPVPVSKSAVAPALAPAPARQKTTDRTSTLIRLGLIDIDGDQPRKWLPADLRTAVINKTCTSASAMNELLARANHGDLEAQGYISDIKALADNLCELGVMHSPVALSPSDAGRYRLVHGERRFWACLYLAGITDLTPEQALATNIEAFTDGVRGTPEDTDTGDAGDEQLRRLQLQWSENIQRREIASIDFAEQVARHYEYAYASAKTNRRDVLDDLGWDDDGQSAYALAVGLTSLTVEWETGRSLANRTIMYYVACADQIAPEAKALARAHTFSLSTLNRLVRIGDKAGQIAEAERQAQAALAAASGEGKTGSARPTRTQSIINVIQRVPKKTARSGDRQLAQLTPEELQQVLAAAEQAHASFSEYCKRVRDMLMGRGLQESRWAQHCAS